MENRLRQIREAKGLSLEDFAPMVGSSTSAVARVERGESKLEVEKLLRYAEALGVAPHEIVPALAPRPNPPPRHGLSDDGAPFDHNGQGGATGLPDTQFRWKVTTPALDKLGIEPGNVLIVDIGKDVVAGARTGDAVVCQHAAPGGKVRTILRQFVEPGLFVVNSRNLTEPPLDETRDDIQLMGVVIRLERTRTLRKTG